MSDLTSLNLHQARLALKEKKCSATELAKAHIQHMEKASPLNAVIFPTAERALQDAKKSDDRLQKGEGGLLEGIPLGIKDLFCTKDIRTTACSHILGNFTPTYESHVTQKLWDEGGVMLGKLNHDEFAMGSSNETSYFGVCINPWRRKGKKEDERDNKENGRDKKEGIRDNKESIRDNKESIRDNKESIRDNKESIRDNKEGIRDNKEGIRDNTKLVAGGSSGGSSAAVAAHIGCATTATDTGGSIRQPASFTGTVGLKPSYGRCSRWGIIAFASSLDQAGPITRNIRDASIMLQAMAGYDERDSTSINLSVPNYENSIGSSIKGLRIGIPKEYQLQGLAKDIQTAWDKGKEWLRDAGCKLINVSLPHTKYALPAYYIIAPAEASSNLARYDGVRYGIRTQGKELKDLDALYEHTRAKGFGNEVKNRLLIGTYVLSSGYYDAYYTKALKLRRLIFNDFTQAFKTCDVLLTPTTPSAAFGIGEKIDNPLDMYMNDILTVPVNLAGLPALSLPAGLDRQGLPLGLQLIGQRFDEETILRVGFVMEQAANFTARPEKWWQI